MRSCHPGRIAGIFVLLLFLSACRKETLEKSRLKEFSLTSAINGGTYPITVALPENYSSAKQYKTLYVLDAEWDFNFTATECDKLSRTLGKEGVLVVGIGWGHDRLDDYTPSPTDMGAGNADKFALFLQTELIPRIESGFNAIPDRAARGILGHSAGGLFTAHCFTNYNELFGNYLALSPAAWWDGGIVLRNEQVNRARNQTSAGNIFLAVGGLEEKMRPPFEGLRNALQAHYPNYIRGYYITPQRDHMDSKKPNILKALSFFFNNI